MTIEIPKKATKAQVKKILKKFENDRRKNNGSKGNVAHLFGSSPMEDVSFFKKS